MDPSIAKRTGREKEAEPFEKEQSNNSKLEECKPKNKVIWKERERRYGDRSIETS